MRKSPQNHFYTSILSTLNSHNEAINVDFSTPDNLVRMQPKSAGAAGIRECMLIREGLVALISNVQHNVNHSETYVSDSMLKLHFRLRGHSGLALNSKSITESVQPMACGMLLQPEGMPKTEVFAANTQELSLTLFCSREFLDQISDDSEVSLPVPISDMINNRAYDFFSMGFQMPPEILAATRRLFDISGAGALHGIQLQAGCLDLLGKMLRYVSIMAGGATSTQPRKHDLERVIAICDLLDQDLSHSPTISELARAVGWNETQLTQTFRNIMGVTVYEYRHRAAMDAAITLLLESELPITQIAFEVGYQYSSNFSTAFRKEFGMTPAAIRKQGSIEAPRLLTREK